MSTLSTGIDTTTHILLEEADLLPLDNEIENQGPVGVCTAEGLVKLFELQSARVHDIYPTIPQLKFSVLYNYFWAGNFEGRVGQEGRSPEDAFVAALVKGMCPEDQWPWDLSKLDIQPPVSCDLSALKWRIREYTTCLGWSYISDATLALPATLDNIRHAVCQGRPVAISMPLTEDFRTQWHLQSDWRTFHWDWHPSTSNPIIGIHETVIPGYSNRAGQMMLQNSWDKECDGGFCGAPYEMFGDASWGVQTALCSIWDSIGHIPLPGYNKIVYPPSDLIAINNYLENVFQPVRSDAVAYGVSCAKMDAARNWPAGTSKSILGVQ